MVFDKNALSREVMAPAQCTAMNSNKCSACEVNCIVAGDPSKSTPV